METAALVLGIISLLISVLGGTAGLSWIGSVCGILGIIFGALGMKKGNPERGKAKAGLILSIIAFTWGIVVAIACVACVGAGVAGVTAIGLTY